MLFFLKTIVRTSILFLLFTIGSGNLFAIVSTQTTFLNNCVSNQLHIFSTDTITSGDVTIQPENQRSADINIPKELAEKTIDFQLNAEIHYLNIRHFILPESKKQFIQLWMKENEIDHIHIKTDSLRKAYSNSSDDQKAALAEQILKEEDQLLLLNEEIPVISEKIRKNEIEYWQNAPEEDFIKFQETIINYEDSLQTAADILNQQKLAEYEKRSNTVILDLSTQKTDTKEEKAASITYKIQIGEYKGKVPDSTTKLIKKLSTIRKIEKTVDEKGMTTFTTGNLKAFSEAETMQNQIKQEGVKNPIIIAFQKNNKISVSEARKLNHE